MRELLSKSRYPVLWAKSAREAREVLNDSTIFSLLPLDRRLPDTDGLALLHELHRWDPELPIVMLSGEEDIS